MFTPRGARTTRTPSQMLANVTPSLYNRYNEHKGKHMDLDFGLAPITLPQFVQGATNHYLAVVATTPTYRVGQAYSNYLSHHFPGIARRIVATNCDPFHTEQNIARLLRFLVDERVLRA